MLFPQHSSNPSGGGNSFGSSNNSTNNNNFNNNNYNNNYNNSRANASGGGGGGDLVFDPRPADGIIKVDNFALFTTVESIQADLLHGIPVAAGETHSSYELALQHASQLPDLRYDASAMDLEIVREGDTRCIPLVVFKCDVFRGQGFVQLQNPEDVPAAVAALNNREYRTRMISARVSSYAERHHRLVAYAACVLAGGHIVRLRGLDFGITAERIRYFLQRQLAPVVVDGITIEITRHMCGTASGDAFLGALSVDNVRQILQLHMQTEGRRQIEVMEATHQDRVRVSLRVGQRMALPWQAKRGGRTNPNNNRASHGQAEGRGGALPGMMMPANPNGVVGGYDYHPHPHLQQQQQQQQPMGMQFIAGYTMYNPPPLDPQLSPHQHNYYQQQQPYPPPLPQGQQQQLPPPPPPPAGQQQQYYYYLTQ